MPTLRYVQAVCLLCVIPPLAGPTLVAADPDHRLEPTSSPREMMPTRRFQADPVSYYWTREEAREAFANGDCRQAAELLERLTSAFPDDGDNWLLLAHCRSRLGKWVAATAAYEAALDYGAFPFDLTDDVNPNDTMVHVARAHAQSGALDDSLYWLERALANRYDDRPTLGTDGAFEALKKKPRFRSLAGLPPNTPLAREEGWRTDLAYLGAEMLRLHPDPTHVHSKETFDAAFRSLTNRITDLDDHQMTAEVARLIALLGNGHNLLLPFPSRHGGLVRFPFKLYVFADGVYIVDAEVDHSDLVGARVDRFGSRPSEQALAALRPFIARDNNTQLGFLGAMWLAMPHVLEAAGVIEDANGATLEITLPNCEKRVLRDLALLPFELDTYGLRSSDPRVTSALYLSNFEETLWMKSLPDKATLYLQLTDVQPCCGMTISEFSERARARADETGAEHLVIDLRNNAGGNGYLAMGLVRLAAYFEVSRGQQSVFVLFGRNSLSAAHNLLADLDRITDAVLVGEPSGSSTSAYAENGWFRLPYSGLFGFLSSQLHQYSWPEDHRVWIAPHVPITLTAEDYFSGRDPGLEAISSIIEGRSEALLPAPSR